MKLSRAMYYRAIALCCLTWWSSALGDDPAHLSPGSATSPDIEAAIVDQRNSLIKLAEGADPVTAMDASYRLWSHYQANDNQEEARRWQERFFSLLHQRGESGDPNALIYLGGLYAQGNELYPQDLVKARMWFEKAAEAGDATAQYQTGVYYHSGTGGPRDEVKAAMWFSRALKLMRGKADHGDVKAAFWVGQMYFQGLGVDVDYAQAFHYYRKAAEQGDTRSQMLVAFMHREGRGTVMDERKAVGWFEKAAQSNDLGAIMEVALAYREGKGVDKDPARAMQWLEKGASLNDLYALRTLGVMYADGDGVERDKAKAIEYLTRSASLGDVYSALEASRLMADDDAESAYEIIKQVANKTHSPPAVYELGLWEGRRGDKDMYAKLMQEAAESGYTPAMVVLARLHVTPFSKVSWNPRISYYWLSIAEKRGDESAAVGKKWLLWGGGGAVLLIAAVILLLLNRLINKRLKEQEGAVQDGSARRG